MFVREKTYNTLAAAHNAVVVDNAKLQKEIAALHTALLDILTQRTAAPNATVTRMLKIAEEALGLD